MEHLAAKFVNSNAMHEIVSSFRQIPLCCSFMDKARRKLPLESRLRTPAFLKVFRRGPQRDGRRRVVAVHVDKSRKDEAAGGEALPMGKERRRRHPHGAQRATGVLSVRHQLGFRRQPPLL